MSWAEDFNMDIYDTDFVYTDDWDGGRDTYKVELVHQTEKAYLFNFGDFEAWIPKSVCYYNTGDGVVDIDDYFKIKKLKKENIEDMFDDIEQNEGDPFSVEPKTVCYNGKRIK